MKIAILTSFFASTLLSDNEKKAYNLKPGHSFPWITNLAENIARFGGNEVHVVTISSEFPSDYTVKKNEVIYNFLNPGNKYLRVVTCYESEKWKLHRFLKANNFDIVHGQGFEKYGYFAVTSGLPNVITIHLYNNKSIRNFFKYDKFSIIGLYNSALRSFQQLSIRKNMKHLISISGFITEEFKNKSNPKFIYNIENAISPIFFSNIERKDKNFILYVGSIDARKSLLDLLKAIRDNKEIYLKIISTTDSGLYFENVKSFITSSEMNERVELLGSKMNSDIVNEMSECSFLVLPSKREGAPLVISEAMAVGKPVIASNVDGMPYMIKDGETGLLFEPGNIEQLKEKITVLYKDPELRKSMGKAAKEEAKKRWHPDVVAHKTISAYTEIINNRIV